MCMYVCMYVCCVLRYENIWLNILTGEQSDNIHELTQIILCILMLKHTYISTYICTYINEYLNKYLLNAYGYERQQMCDPYCTHCCHSCTIFE